MSPKIDTSIDISSSISNKNERRVRFQIGGKYIAKSLSINRSKEKKSKNLGSGSNLSENSLIIKQEMNTMESAINHKTFNSPSPLSVALSPN